MSLANCFMRSLQRILVIRLDRIGDVLLSTPTLHALRNAYPKARITAMVRPPCQDLLDGHPAVDDVLVYEKEGRHRSVWATIAFAYQLSRERFDLAIILHPSHRSHWIPFLAVIPQRVGFDRKSGWLLTTSLPHIKQEGRYHELDYTLDVVAAIGVPLDGIERRPTMAVSAAARAKMASWLTAQGVAASQRLIAIHPSASGPEKRYPADRFAAVADRMMKDANVRVVVVGGAAGVADAEAVQRAMHQQPLMAAGVFNLQELAALLQRCRLLVSNDSGPVHVAVSQGTPVLSLFGRTQPGVNPERWKPLGPRDRVLLREPITALSVEDVIKTAKEILQAVC